MMTLRTEGFPALVAEAADRARRCASVSDAARLAQGLDGRVPPEIGSASLTLAEQGMLDLAEGVGAALRTDVDDGFRLALTATGRVCLVAPGGELAAGDHLVGGIGLAGELTAARRLWRMAEGLERQVFADVARELARLPAEEVHDQLARIEYALTHMAPVLLYVGTRTYSNLGAFSNLPGKSMRANAPASLLNVLRGIPVGEWAAEDATFVACLTVLLRSGPAVRAEEFNGVQLTPDKVEDFLVERIEAYGGTPPAVGRLGRLEGLTALAEMCSQLRHGLIADGAVFYRSINGLTLHKREKILSEPIAYADVPAAVHAALEERRGARIPEDFDSAADALRAIVARMPQDRPGEDFSSPFEEFLHHLLAAVANATQSDVSMGRGPRDLAGLSGDAAPPDARLKMGTKEFYCCVTPSDAFLRRFGDDRDELVRALSAYSSRMRYNTWHYWPHSFGLTGKAREDWFFAPTMPDITDWSDQHHTGHVTFGVRYAIRVPSGIDFDGAYRAGLFDLRLMRTREPAYPVRILRSGVAVGRLLGVLHQTMVPADQPVRDFGNDWYRRFYG